MLNLREMALSVPAGGTGASGRPDQTPSVTLASV